MRCLFQLFTIVAIGLSTSSAIAQFDGAAPVPKELKQGFDSITEEQAKEFLSILAGPKFSGRGTGQAGYIKAAHFVAGKLAEYGFEPCGDRGTYFQDVPMTRIGPDLTKSFILGPGNLKIPGGDDLGFISYAKTPSVTGKVVLLNVSGAHNDWPQDLMLRDKIAIVVSDKPNTNLKLRIRRKRPLATIWVVDGKPTSNSRVVREGSQPRYSTITAIISRKALSQIEGRIKSRQRSSQAQQENRLSKHTLSLKISRSRSACSSSRWQSQMLWAGWKARIQN